MPTFSLLSAALGTGVEAVVEANFALSTFPLVVLGGYSLPLSATLGAGALVTLSLKFNTLDCTPEVDPSFFVDDEKEKDPGAGAGATE